MTVTIVPPQRIVTCDGCGKQDAPRVRKTKMILERHAVDMHGAACADASMQFDFCDSCASIVERAINKAVEEECRP